MVDLWRRRWTKDELLARVGRLEQLAGVQLVEAGDGAERGVRWAGAEVVQAAVFCEQLTLTRRIEADLGGQYGHLPRVPAQPHSGGRT